ncbi:MULTISPECIES: hypothetical protein [Streptomyces]|nr:MULTISPECIES: hypothetical protein [Streptomyces]
MAFVVADLDGFLVVEEDLGVDRQQGQEPGDGDTGQVSSPCGAK